MMRSFFFSIILLGLFLPALSFGNNDSLSSVKVKKVYVFKIHEEIAPPIWRKTKMALEEARNISADLVIIDMNTYGGAVVSADSIRTAILASDIPVYVFINNNAASAGALISISCDSIYMKPGANIGAATVVNQEGKKMPDKYQSYMRSTMRSTAEVSGRDPQIAEAMVDESIVVESISKEGQVLTFTTYEAIKYGFCEGEAESIRDVLELLHIEEYKIIKQELTIADHIIGFLISPFISGILIMVIIGGLYFELQSPGVGFPIAASAIAALLYFAPLYLEGLAENWEVVIFIIGVILVAVEIFALPGFGVAGISGGVLIITGLTLSMVENTTFTFSTAQIDSIAKAFFIVIIAMFLSILGSIYLGSKFFKTSAFSHIALAATQEKNKGYTISDEKYEHIIGKEGVTQSILRPVGKIIVEEEVYDAFSDAGFIDREKRIRVIGYRNAQLVVREV